MNVRSVHPKGFIFMEVLASMFLFSLTVVALMAVRANALTLISEMQCRVEAMSYANRYAARMWAASDDARELFKEGGEEYERLRLSVQGDNAHHGAGLPGSTNPSVNITTTASGGKHVHITLFWRLPGEETLRNHTQTSFISH